MRALGKQGEAAGPVLVSYYVFALPIGLVCAFFFDLKVRGLWIGTFFGVLFQAISFLRVILRTDW